MKSTLLTAGLLLAGWAGSSAQDHEGRMYQIIDSVSSDQIEQSLTAVNAITLASLASAPPAPDTVWIGGAVSPSTRLKWRAVGGSALAGYTVYWRDTSAPQWQYSRFVGTDTTYTLDGIVIDNYLFGVASVGKDGAESVVKFPGEIMR